MLVVLADAGKDLGLRTGQGKRWRIAVAIGLLATVLAVVAPPGATAVPESAAAPGAGRVVATPVRAAAGGDGLRIESRTTYVLDVAATTIRVRYDVTLTNQSPDVVSGGFIRQRYFPEYSIGALSEATNFSATKADGTPLSVRTEPTESPRFSFVVVDLSPNLFYPNSQTLSISYDLPRLPPRSEGFTRVNEAFATFPVYGIGDPGITSVEIQIPEAMQVELIGSAMEKTERDGLQVYTAEAIADPEEFFVDVVARDDEKLVRRLIDLGETDVEVLGWPDDPEWADFVAELVEGGVPALGELTGIDWPAEDDIEVVETVAPYLYGYAGWYQPSAALIEVGDQLEAQVILHELAHVWFNDDLFQGRWINEALAEVFSSQALEELGEEAGAPEPVRSDAPGAVRLNQWGEPDIQAGDTEAREAYGYNASWSVMQGIVDEVGIEALAEAVRMADAHHLPYTAETGENILTRVPDWRALLDLLEETSGSETAEQVFRDLVVSEADVALLDERAEARELYDELEARGDGWAPPLEVRTDMSDWDFDDATALMPAVEGLFDVRDELGDVVADIDVPIPPELQVSFEGARDVEGDLTDTMDRALAAGEDLRDADQAHRDGAGPIGAVGLLLSGVDDDLDGAHDAFQAGNYTVAAERAASVSDQIDGAVTAGLLRLAGLLALIVVVLLLVRWQRRRRARRASVVDEPVVEPADPAMVDADPAVDATPAESVAAAPASSEPEGAEGVGGAADGRGEGGV